MATGPGALEAGPRQGGYQPPLAGQERPAQPSQSPMKVSPKVQRQKNMQYQLSQQDLQQPPSRVYLPSAPMGAPRAPEMSQRSLANAAAEQQLLEQEVRANDELYRFPGETPGEVWVTLQHPVLPTGWTNEPLVPRIRGSELHVCDAGIRMRDQAKIENLCYFKEKEEERQQKAKPLVADVDQLAATMAGAPQQAAAAKQREMPIPPVMLMDMGATETEAEKVQGDDSMADDDGAEGDKEDVELEEV